MKKLAIFITIGLAVVCIGAPNRDMSDYGTLSAITRQYEYFQLASVSTADTALASNTKTWNLINPASNTNWFAVRPSWSVVELAFYAYGDGSGDGDPTNGTFDVRVFAARPYAGAKLVIQASCTVGGIALSANPTTGSTTGFNSGAADASYKWVDTIAEGGQNDEWVSGVTLSGEDGDDPDGNIATMNFDLNGYWAVWTEITNLSTVTSVISLITGY